MNLSKKQATALLSLLAIPGILSMPFLYNTPFYIISILACLIGGFSFGKLVSLLQK